MLALADGGQYLYVSFVGESANARVDLDKETPTKVAGEYLKESGLVGS